MLLNSQPDYNNKPKNIWRRTVWKQIAMRSNCNQSECIGIYLPAEHDLDRRHAIQQGFRPYNLIGVDSDIKIVRKMRRRGNICIHADFIDVLKSWPKSTPLMFVNADFCCGFSRAVMQMNEVLLSETFNSNKHIITFCINLQRGRDSDSNMFRLSLKDSYMYEDIHGFPCKKTYVINGRLASIDESIKHRGVQFYTWVTTELMEWLAAEHQADPASVFIIGKTADILSRASYKARFFSYKSNVVNMDSVVFEWGAKLKTTIKHKDTKTLNKIKAALAVRSMKISGKLRQAAIA